MLTTVDRKPRVPAQPQLRLPSIALVLPFEPCATGKSVLESTLATALLKVEEKLAAAFPPSLCRPALQRLKAVLGGLNFQTTRRSVAVFLSAFAEKVYYLAMPVRPRVCVDGHFTMRDLLASKLDERRHLLLQLGAEGAEVFLAGHGPTTRILVNRASQPRQGGLKITHAARLKYLKSVDRNVQLLLRSFPYPLMVTGEGPTVSEFKQLSGIARSRVYYLPSDRDGLPICLKKDPVLWPTIKEKLLLATLDEALMGGQVAIGISEVWTAASEKRSRLLVVEEDFCYPMPCLPGDAPRMGDGPDLVDAILERVLSCGGNVEVVPSGTLGDFMHIALI